MRQRITFDPAKRAWTLRERGVDFVDAVEVFAGPVYEEPDHRRDYGETRIVTAGFCAGGWWSSCGRVEAMRGTSFR